MANQFLIKETMADMKALSAAEISALQAGTYAGVQLLGYYEKGDTPNSILYFLSNSLDLGDGGSIIKVQDIVLEHQFTSQLHPSYFGIVSSDITRQDERLEKFSTYVDKFDIYEVDFFGYSIVAPKTLLFTTSISNQVRGLGFKKVHKIKNLKISNDKTEKLIQGCNCIVFYPSEDGNGTFELENVIFDPYVSDYSIVGNWEYDGLMLGFLCYADPSWTGFTHRLETNYKVKINKVDFVSPAISYNISLAGIFMQENIITNSKGDYWGLYIHVFAKNTVVDNLNGVFRSDLQVGSGRTLVKTLVHQEPEIATNVGPNPPSLMQETISMKDVVCVDKAGIIAQGFKLHALANLSISKIIADNFRADFQLYVSDPDMITSVVDKVIIQNSTYYDVIPKFYITIVANNLVCTNSNVSFSGEYALVSSRNSLIQSVIFKNSIVRNFSFQGQGTGTINNLIIEDCTIVKVDIGRDNLVNNTAVTIRNVNMRNCIVNTQQLFKCTFENIVLDNIVFSEPYYNDTFYLSSPINAKLSINRIRINADLISQFNFFITGVTGSQISYSIINSYTGRRLRMSSNTIKIFEVATFPLAINSTANRPTNLDARSAGLQFIDTTLNKVVTWNGTAWLTGEANATTALKGLVSQSAAVSNSNINHATDLATAIALVNELKDKLNSKFEADRSSGQQMY